MIVPLRSKRRERVVLLQKLQHGVPAVVLLATGLSTLGGEPHGFALLLAIFEIASSVLLIGTFIRALRQARRPASPAGAEPPHHGPDWIHIFTGLVLFTEVAEHYHLTHHIRRPTLVLAAALLTIGLIHGRIVRRAEKRFTLRVDDAGLYVGGKPFRSIRAAWDQLEAIEVGERYGIIKLRDGRQRKLDLPDLEGSDRIRAALQQARERFSARSAPPLAPLP